MPLQADRAQGRADPLAAFRHRLVGQTDDGEGRQAGTHLHLDLDLDRVDALEGDGLHVMANNKRAPAGAGSIDRRRLTPGRRDRPSSRPSD